MVSLAADEALRGAKTKVDLAGKSNTRVRSGWCSKANARCSWEVGEARAGRGEGRAGRAMVQSAHIKGSTRRSDTRRPEAVRSVDGLEMSCQRGAGRRASYRGSRRGRCGSRFVRRWWRRRRRRFKENAPVVVDRCASWLSGWRVVGTTDRTVWSGGLGCVLRTGGRAVFRWWSVLVALCCAALGRHAVTGDFQWMGPPPAETLRGLQLSFRAEPLTLTRRLQLIRQHGSRTF